MKQFCSQTWHLDFPSPLVVLQNYLILKAHATQEFKDKDNLESIKKKKKEFENNLKPNLLWCFLHSRNRLEVSSISSAMQSSSKAALCGLFHSTQQIASGSSALEQSSPQIR